MEDLNTNENPHTKNIAEREKALQESDDSFKERIRRKDELPATDLESRIGVYKEMLEPQVREAVSILVSKGYFTIDSGYDSRRITEGTQYIGFKKGMIDKSLLPTIIEKIAAKFITPTIESDDRSDYLLLEPREFINLEAWKEIWDDVVETFPNRNEAVPIKKRFIDRNGH